MRAPPRFINVFLALIFLVSLLSAGFWAASTSVEAKHTKEQVAAVKALQTQELATFNLLKDALAKSGPQTKVVIEDLLARIQKLDTALLHAIQTNSHVLVVPGRTTTRTRIVCRTPSGKAC